MFEDTDVFDESTNGSHRYPNIPNTTNIRSPRYINTNTYSNLPENWSEHISHSGLPYYYNMWTGESHWQTSDNKYSLTTTTN